MRLRARALISHAVLALCLVLVGLAPAYAQTPPDTVAAVDVAHAEYNNLLDQFYKPLAPADLLQAAWTALSDDMRQHNLPTPPSLGPLPDDRDGAFAAFSDALASYESTLPSSVTQDAIATDLGTGMAESVHEGHTHYLPPIIFQRMLAALGAGDQQVGLGVGLGGGSSRLITEVFPGSPAEQAGLKPGDVIVAVDGQDVTRSSGGAIGRLLAGSAGSQVTLTVDRGGPQATIVVTRGAYSNPAVQSRMLPGNIGYLRLESFVIAGARLPNGTEVLSELNRQLTQLESAGATGLVVDLRENGGGDVYTADKLLGAFLPEDALAGRDADERGHSLSVPVAGQMRSTQLPMALLVDGGSGSASELVAAALQESHRAVLVGQRTAGDLATSELIPLPGNAAVQIAVAAATSPSGALIDTVGVTPDVQVQDTRTASDYRAGNDPQLNAAVTALSSAPPPPAASPVPPTDSAADLERQLGPIFPSADEIPTTDRMQQVVATQRLDVNQPNEWIDLGGLGARDPAALRTTIRSRGYQGSVLVGYGVGLGQMPAVSVSADLYASDRGASSALETNDFPDVQDVTPSPLQLGDEAVGYRGTWLQQGAAAISWRRGRIVLSVAYDDVPGFERPDELAAIAQLVDQHAQSMLAAPAGH